METKKIPNYLTAERPGMSSNNVEVKFMRTKDPIKPRFYFRVELRSEVRPAHKVHIDVVFSNNMEHIMQTAGGALAEKQNELLGDRHNPSEVAAAAWEAYRELKSELNSKKPEDIDPHFTFKLFIEEGNQA